MYTGHEPSLSQYMYITFSITSSAIYYIALLYKHVPVIIEMSCVCLPSCIVVVVVVIVVETLFVCAGLTWPWPPSLLGGR